MEVPKCGGAYKYVDERKKSTRRALLTLPLCILRLDGTTEQTRLYNKSEK